MFKPLSYHLEHGMAIKCAGYDCKPEFLNGCNAQSETMIMSTWILTKLLILMAMIEMMVDLGEKRRVH
jgi:hypothetical protein